MFRLRKSIYGLRDSGKMFFEHCRDNFVQNLQFQQSKNDPCMFFKNGIVAVVYVDDILFFSKSSKLINKAIADLEKTFELTKEEEDQDVFAYLGVSVNRNKDADGKEVIELVQPGLIDKIISKIKQHGKSVKDSKTRTEHTPASTQPLHADKDGDDFDEKEFGCSYASAIGLIMYPANMRPDIQYAVNAAS